VFGNILHRMILLELCKVFLMSLIGITGILLMAGIIAEASQQGLGPAQILAAIPLLIPSTLPYTIPATTLFATCVVYGRLAADNEILAIKAAGINILTVIKPALVLGLAMSAATMGLYYRIIPYTHHLLRAMVFNDAEELLYSVLKKHGMISHSSMPYSMFVKGVQGRKLLQPVFKRKGPRGQPDIVANAREAELRVDSTRQPPVLLILMKNGVASSEGGDRGYFENRTFEVPLPTSLGKDANRRARDMTWQELLSRREELEKEMEKTTQEMATVTAYQLLKGAAEDLPQHVKNLKDRLKQQQQQILFIDVELLMRPALSLGCLCFILVGCPVGISMGRSDYLSTFILCFLPIVFSYYPLMLCGTNMAKEARFDPILLVWAADIFVGTTGLLLFRRLLRN
jgi:lipopolysaccharide export system permease protein